MKLEGVDSFKWKFFSECHPRFILRYKFYPNMNARIWELKTSSIDVVSACRNRSIYAVTDDAV
jgi:hypothetical protein